MHILSEWKIDKNTSAARANLLMKSQSFPDLRFIAAACFLKIGDLYAIEGNLKEAKSSYLIVAEDESSDMAQYRVLAEERLKKNKQSSGAATSKKLQKETKAKGRVQEWAEVLRRTQEEAEVQSRALERAEAERRAREVAERRRQEERRLANIIDTEIQDNFRSQIRQVLEYERTGASRKWNNSFTHNIVLVTITKTYDSRTLPCREFKISLVGNHAQVERMKRACRDVNGVWKW